MYKCDDRFYHQSPVLCLIDLFLHQQIYNWWFVSRKLKTKTGLLSQDPGYIRTRKKLPAKFFNKSNIYNFLTDWFLIRLVILDKANIEDDNDHRESQIIEPAQLEEVLYWPVDLYCVLIQLDLEYYWCRFRQWLTVVLDVSL